MTTLFLYMFFVGFGLTLVSALLGMLDLSGLGHVGHGGDLSGTHVGDLGHGGHAGHIGHGAHAGHAGDLSHGGDVTEGHGAHAATVSPINFQTLVAFVTGFGGFGYLASHYGSWVLALVLLLAAAGGLAMAWVIFRWMKFIVSGERPLPPTSYIGVVGTLTLGIREGGTGELVYTQSGTRTVVAARSLTGRPIPKGDQVVVLRYENGFAYVQPWQEFMDQSNTRPE
jgi:hypothetical protein